MVEKVMTQKYPYKNCVGLAIWKALPSSDIWVKSPSTL